MPTETTIPPALTAEEWAQLHDSDVNTLLYIDPIAGLCITPSDWDRPVERPAAVVAIANAALPDGDRRKLTRDLAHRLGVAAVALEHDAAAFGVHNADFVASVREAQAIIAALLPPK